MYYMFDGKNYTEGYGSADEARVAAQEANAQQASQSQAVLGDSTERAKDHREAQSSQEVRQMGSYLFDDPTRITRSAEVSACGRYRWWLRRSWSLWSASGEQIKGLGDCCFIMLNPSTADAYQDDPTIRRCIAFAKNWGYDSLSVRNLFPWRATDPRELFKADTVTGGHRGDTELLSACTANLTIAAWGANVPFNRDPEAMDLFRQHFPAVPLYCLGKTKHGHPRHPLYVRADTQLQRFN